MPDLTPAHTELQILRAAIPRVEAMADQAAAVLGQAEEDNLELTLANARLERRLAGADQRTATLRSEYEYVRCANTEFSVENQRLRKRLDTVRGDVR
jgi:regulator of replication initiation timing